MRDHITVSGKRCEVTPLRHTAGQRSRGWPKAEVFAPDGFEFSGGETSLCVHAATDLDEIEQHEHLAQTVDSSN